VDAATSDELIAVMDLLRGEGEDPLLIGGGSNLLVRDGGLNQVVVRWATGENNLVPTREGTMITALASLPLDVLASFSVSAGLDGLVCCSGIPGTVGGAIAGNAGAFGEQIGDRMAFMEVLERDGRCRTLHPGEAGFDYRRSALPARGCIVLAATWDLTPVPVESLAARRGEILALRAEKHPDWRITATAGSFFKNVVPTSQAGRRQAAGWFLEQAGALALRVGGARTFARHANIIVAEPGATAAEVEQLAADMAGAVHRMFGLALEREVQMIGHERVLES
jgi:UDP-N-acetylmuramate dehydrogenase